MRFPVLRQLRAATVIAAVWTLTGMLSLAAEPLQLRVRFCFDEASGSVAHEGGTATSNGAVLQVIDFNGAPADKHGGAGSGISAEQLDRALDFTSRLGQGTNGPVAAMTNSSLKLGTFKQFTATMWFKVGSAQRANIGPRLFLLGPTDITADTGTTNTVGLKFQTASLLHFQLNQVTAEADFVWSLPLSAWVYIAMVYDGEHVFVYRGGTDKPADLVSAKAALGQSISVGESAALFIGNRRDRARSFDGLIDDFRLYTGAADALMVEKIRLSAVGARAGNVNGNAQTKSEAGKYVVVCPPAFTEPIGPLVERRRAEGFNVTLLRTAELAAGNEITGVKPDNIMERLQKIFAGQNAGRYLLLVGIAGGAGSPECVVPATVGAVGRMKGEATDVGYSFPDEFGRPTVAVGRLPCRDLQELKAMIAKIERLEDSRTNSAAWRNGLLLIQGSPGGGSFAEAYVDGIARPRIGRVHSTWRLEVISHNSPSAYYVPSAWLAAEALNALRRGHLFAIYLGHSYAGGITSGSTNFLSSRDWSSLDMGAAPGVFFTCGCFACQHDKGEQQAYGVAAMRNPKGPAAVIGASGESFAAPGLLAVDGLLRCCGTAESHPRLGQYWLSVQMGIAEGEIDPFTFSLLDYSDGTQQKVPLSVQRREHLEMWELLGDPAVKLPIVPQCLELRTQGRITPGQKLQINGTAPATLNGAKIFVTLERPPGVRFAQRKTEKRMSIAEKDQVAVENQRTANEPIIAKAQTVSDERGFSCSLEVPPEIPYPVLLVRVYAEQKSECGSGVLKLPVMAGN